MKSFQYRIYPNKEQIDILNKTLELCRNLYNTALYQRITGYKLGYKVSFYTQSKELKELNKDNGYEIVHSQVLVNVLKRLDQTYQNFYRRLKSGQKPGSPRYKSETRFNSFTYPQYTKLTINHDTSDKIYIPKIGDVKIKYHRPIQGKPKTLTVKRVNNKWYVVITCNGTPVKERIKNITKIVGIDLGIKYFLVTSDGKKAHNPKFVSKFLVRIQKLQQILSRKHKGSNRYNKTKSRLRTLYEKITNIRNDFLHKVSRWLVDNYDCICYEDLKVKEMLDSQSQRPYKHSLNRNILDVSWNRFIGMVTYKAEEAGKYTIPVDPKNTSKRCSNCGYVNDQLELKDRTYNCPNCGISLDRDYNASKNIYWLGSSLISDYLS
jgi:putative transposase